MRRRALIAAGGAVLAAGCTARLDESTATPASFDGFDDADRVVVADDGDAPVRLELDRETFRLDPDDDVVETFPLTLSNQSGGQVSFDPEAWRLHRQTSKGWEPQYEPERDGPATVLDDSETFRWVLATQSHPSSKTTHTEDVIAALDSGRYAFSVTVDVEGRAIECVAQFDVRLE